ncbi:uncharacterized protein CEXT_87711 [Caerostris extrusa]|uniref:Uncharacterized protein n=1 Tax=Caerostris extrusa TaxID=172846 RepID=A0AAV4Y2H0_CAEEX|nr:uncharacterized protein CEXT_87711 [Caerostris extrusa]
MKEDIHHRAIVSASKIPQLIKHPQFEDIQKNSTPSEGNSTAKNSDSCEFSINDSTKDSKTSCSCTCCLFEKEKIKAYIKDLRDRIQILAVELIKCKNSNQLLKKDITTARAVVKREIGRNVENFEDLLKKAQEHGWKGHQEQILSLKKRIKGTERQTKKRKVNKEMEHQIACIREQLDATPKEENDVFLSHLREIEKKTKFCLEDKSKLKRALDKEKRKRIFFSARSLNWKRKRIPIRKYVNLRKKRWHVEKMTKKN